MNRLSHSCQNYLVISILLFLLSACNDSDNSATDTQFDTPSILYLGEQTTNDNLSSALDEHITIYQSLFEIPTNESIDAIVINGDQLDNVFNVLDYGSLINDVLHNGNTPIILFDADGLHANALLSHLDLPATITENEKGVVWRKLSLINNQPHWNHYSIIMDATESLTDENFLAALSTVAHNHAVTDLIQELTNDNQTLEKETDTINHEILSNLTSNIPTGELKALTDKEENQLFSHANINENKDNPTNAQLINNTDNPELTGNLLTELVTPQSSTRTLRVYYDTDDSTLHTCDSTTSSDCVALANDLQNAKYSIYLYSYTFYSIDLDKDFHLTRVSTTLAQSNAYTKTSKTHRAWFASQYGLYNVVRAYHPSNPSCSNIFTLNSGSVGICDDSDSSTDCTNVLTSQTGLSFIEASPSTQTNCNVTSYTSGTTYSVSGATQVGSSNTATLTGGMSMSDSTTHTVSSVCISDYSNSSEYSEISTVFKFPEPDTTKNTVGCYKKIESPSNQSTSTFPASSTYIWATDRSVRDSQNALGYNSIQICGALYYEWKDVKIKNSCDVGDGSKKKRNESTWYGFTSFSNLIEMTQITE